MKTGDLEPNWRVHVSDGDKVADLSAAQSWRFTARLDGQIIFTDTNPGFSQTGLEPWEAILTHEWVAGETDKAGKVTAEIVAVWPGNREQTFPSRGRVYLFIQDSV